MYFCYLRISYKWLFSPFCLLIYLNHQSLNILNSEILIKSFYPFTPSYHYKTDNYIKFLADIKNNNFKSKSERLLLNNNGLSLKINEIKNSNDTLDLLDANYNLITKPSNSRNGITLEVEEYEKNLHLYQDYQSSLYLELLSFTLSKHSKICIKIELKDGDRSNSKTLKSIFPQIINDGELQYAAFTSIEIKENQRFFKEDNKLFHDEIKINLPGKLNDGHHLFFTYFTVPKPDKMTKAESKVEFKPIGFSFYKLYQNNRFRNDFLTNSLEIYEFSHLQTAGSHADLNAFDPTDIGANLNYATNYLNNSDMALTFNKIDKGHKFLHFRLRLNSSIITSDSILSELFNIEYKHYNAATRNKDMFKALEKLNQKLINVQTNNFDGDSGVNVGNNLMSANNANDLQIKLGSETHSVDRDSNSGQAINFLPKCKPYLNRIGILTDKALVGFFPVILNQLLDLLNSTQIQESILLISKVVIRLIHRVQNILRIISD